MLIKSDSDTPYIHCKSCGTNFKMGKSCKCKAVRTTKIEGGAYLIVEDGNNAVIDTE